MDLRIIAYMKHFEGLKYQVIGVGEERQITVSKMPKLMIRQSRALFVIMLPQLEPDKKILQDGN